MNLICHWKVKFYTICSSRATLSFLSLSRDLLSLSSLYAERVSLIRCSPMRIWSLCIVLRGISDRLSPAVMRPEIELTQGLSSSSAERAATLLSTAGSNIWMLPRKALGTAASGAARVYVGFRWSSKAVSRLLSIAPHSQGQPAGTTISNTWLREEPSGRENREFSFSPSWRMLKSLSIDIWYGKIFII